MERQRKVSSEQEKYENSVPQRNSCITGSKVPENVYNSCSICMRFDSTPKCMQKETK